jgi:hypothetical protein
MRQDDERDIVALAGTQSETAEKVPLSYIDKKWI